MASNSNARTMLLYGESGTYKTSQIGHAAKWIYKTYGKRTRLISAENWSPVQSYIDAGMIIPINLKTAKAIPAVLRKIRKGEWVGVANGKQVWLPWEQQTVEACGVSSDDIGMYAIEGLTTISELMMNYLRENQTKIGQEAVTPFEVKLPGSDTVEKFSNNSMGHFGWAQSEVADFTKALDALPTERVILTSHEAKAEDSDREPIRGPGLVGKAKTAQAPSWVGECLHAEAYNVSESYTEKAATKGEKDETIARIGTKVRIFFIRHPDAKFPNFTYPAKPRVPAAMFPELMKRFPGGFFEPTPNDGLDRYLQADYELNQSQGESLRDFMAQMDRERQKTQQAQSQPVSQSAQVST